MDLESLHVKRRVGKFRLTGVQRFEPMAYLEPTIRLKTPLRSRALRGDGLHLHNLGCIGTRTYFLNANEEEVKRLMEKINRSVILYHIGGLHDLTVCCI